MDMGNIGTEGVRDNPHSSVGEPPSTVPTTGQASIPHPFPPSIPPPRDTKQFPLNHFWKAAQFPSVNKKGAYDRENIKTALDCLLFNSIVRLGSHVFKQIKGI